jgi:hypothetical protein
MIISGRTIILLDIFWGVTPCTEVEYHRYFAGIFCLYFQGRRVSRRFTCRLLLATCLDHSSTLKMKAVYFSERYVKFYRTAGSHIPENSKSSLSLLMSLLPASGEMLSEFPSPRVILSFFPHPWPYRLGWVCQELKLPPASLSGSRGVLGPPITSRWQPFERGHCYKNLKSNNITGYFI